MLELLRLDYENKIREKWGESIFRNIIETHDLAESSDEVISDIHKEIEKQRSESQYENNLDYLLVQD